jgi:hypothetical protein
MLLNTIGNGSVAVGAQALQDNTSGSNNTAVGCLSLSTNTTGNNNTAVGFQAIVNASANSNDNVGVGYNALAASATISQCVAVGSGALQANTTAGSTAVGYQALTANTTGFFNTAVGYQALSVNTTGFSNTAVGYQALNTNTCGRESTAIGYQALFSNTSGTNTAIGAKTLYSNTIGTGNVGIGTESTPIGSLQLNTTGNFNTAVGGGALNSITTGSSNLALGFLAGGTHTAGDTGNVDISDGGALGVSHSIRIGATPPSGSAMTTCYIGGISGVTIAPSGSGVFVNSLGQLGTTNSSARYKENIVDFNVKDNPILKFRVVNFNYKQDGLKEYQIGVIAEEVLPLFPELVILNKDGEPETVKHHLLPLLLLDVAQKQESLIKDLQQSLAALETRLANAEKLFGNTGNIT